MRHSCSVRQHTHAQHERVPAGALTGQAATRKPQLPVVLFGVFELRAATRQRLQYEAWQRYEPPRIARRPLGTA